MCKYANMQIEDKYADAQMCKYANGGQMCKSRNGGTVVQMGGLISRYNVQIRSTILKL